MTDESNRQSDPYDVTASGPRGTNEFLAWLDRFRRTGEICPVRLGCTRAYLRELWGQPSDVSTRRHRGEPDILKYGELEFHFRPGADGELFLIFQDTADGMVEVSIGGAT